MYERLEEFTVPIDNWGTNLFHGTPQLIALKKDDSIAARKNTLLRALNIESIVPLTKVFHNFFPEFFKTDRRKY
jgi:hypothetical protein